MSAGIYIFENTINDKQYIGQSIDLDKRIKGHLKQFKTSPKHPKFYNALRKHSGWMIRVIAIPEEGMKYLKDNLDAFEKALIGTYRTAEEGGYNLMNGGANGVPNEETRRKISEAMKNSEKAKAHLDRLNADPEHKEQLARLNADPEFQQKRAEQLARLNASPEHKAQLARLNSDPEFQQKRADHLARLNSDPEYQQKRAEQLARLHQSQRKLSPSQVAEVFQMREEGFLQREIAPHFSVSRVTIGRILRGELYQDLL